LSKVTDLFAPHKLHCGQRLSKICIVSDDSCTVLHTLQDDFHNLTKYFIKISDAS